MTKENFDELTTKHRKILNSLIELYISKSEPVGSKTIAESYLLDLSSASIRNYLEEMERLGYLYKPHTSAGRIPTEKGYRFYISELLKRVEDKDRELDFFKRKFDELHNDVSEFLKYLTHFIADFTKKTAIVMLPKIDVKRPKTIEFVKVAKKRVLIVTVYDYGILENKIIDTEEDLSQDLLVKFSNYINERLSKNEGLDLIRNTLLSEMKMLKELFDKIFESIEKTIEDRLLLIDGQDNLLDFPEFSKVEDVKKIFKTFKEKAKFVDLLTKSLDKNGVQVYIGEDLSLGLDKAAVILSPYGSGYNVIGGIGVFGPMRMDYGNVIPFLISTARFMDKIIGKSSLKTF